MSHPTFTVDDCPASLPYLTLVEALATLDVTFRRKGEGLVLKNGALLTADLLAAVADHKPGLLALADLRAGVGRLFDYGVRLRCADPPKGTRVQALLYQSQQIERLAALAGSVGLTVAGKNGQPTGYSDPGDPWADEALLMLREDLAELEAGPYPVPLLAGCVLLPQANFDPFTAAPPRYYSGKVVGTMLGSAALLRPSSLEQ